MYVKIRRHQHTRVHAHTGPRRHARAVALSGVCHRHHIPRLVRRQAFHTDHTIGSPSLCDRPKGGGGGGGITKLKISVELYIANNSKIKIGTRSVRWWMRLPCGTRTRRCGVASCLCIFVYLRLNRNGELYNACIYHIYIIIKYHYYIETASLTKLFMTARIFCIYFIYESLTITIR